MKRLLTAGLVGAALAAPIVMPAVAQPVPTDPNGFSPFNTRSTIDQNINTPVIRNAPALGLSSIYGLNPCSLGASAGITTPLFGIAGAISTTDKDCEIRNTAALAITGLKDEAAGREIMCILKEFREAVARLGKPCISDQPPARVASAVVPQQPLAPGSSPGLITPTPVIPTAVVVPAATVAPDAPSFCKTPGLVLSVYPECTQPNGQPAPHAERVTKGPQAAPAKVVRPLPVQAPQRETRSARVQHEFTPAAVTVQPVAASAAGLPYSAPVIASPAVLHSNSPGAADVKQAALATDLVQRGAEMLQAGDIVAARLLYERAAKAGNTQAALAIGKTYDPQFLASIHAIGTEGDPVAAENWYRRASAMEDAKTASPLMVAARN